jgi:hypothetical protein
MTTTATTAVLRMPTCLAAWEIITPWQRAVCIGVVEDCMAELLHPTSVFESEQLAHAHAKGLYRVLQWEGRAGTLEIMFKRRVTVPGFEGGRFELCEGVRRTYTFTPDSDWVTENRFMPTRQVALAEFDSVSEIRAWFLSRLSILPLLYQALDKGAKHIECIVLDKKTKNKKSRRAFERYRVHIAPPPPTTVDGMMAGGNDTATAAASSSAATTTTRARAPLTGFTVRDARKDDIVVFGILGDMMMDAVMMMVEEDCEKKKKKAEEEEYESDTDSYDEELAALMVEDDDDEDDEANKKRKDENGWRMNKRMRAGPKEDQGESSASSSSSCSDE